VKRTALLLVTLGALAAPGISRPTPDARLLLYGGAGQGRVVFDARLHRSKGFVCDDCHRELFVTRKTALVDLATHQGGKSCFACHDGARAFQSCDGCHRKAG
jgi:phosphate transport system substrate-binding protein